MPVSEVLKPKHKVLKPRKVVVRRKKLTSEIFYSEDFAKEHYREISEKCGFRVKLQRTEDGIAKTFLSVRKSVEPFKTSAYKFRVSVKKSQLQAALDILLELLTDETSPFTYFKVSYIPLIDRLKQFSTTEKASEYDRLSEGGQITLYINFNTINAIKFATGLAAVTNRLIANKIEVGITPRSDLQISPYFSGRCACILDNAGAATQEYLKVDDHSADPSEDTKSCYLFLLAKLYEIMRLAMLPVRKDDAGWNMAKQKIIDFENNYQHDTTIHHYDLIIKFINEVLKPAERLLGKAIDYSEVTKLLKPKESMPGYNTFAKKIDSTSQMLPQLAAAGGASAASDAAFVDAAEESKQEQQSLAVASDSEALSTRQVKVKDSFFTRKPSMQAMAKDQASGIDLPTADVSTSIIAAQHKESDPKSLSISEVNDILEADDPKDLDAEEVGSLGHGCIPGCLIS